VNSQILSLYYWFGSRRWSQVSSQQSLAVRRKALAKSGGQPVWHWSSGAVAAFECLLHEARCTLFKQSTDVRHCLTCNDREERKAG